MTGRSGWAIRYLLEQIYPMAIVHSDIQNDHRWTGGVNAGQCFAAHADCDYFISFIGQLVSVKHSNALFVINDQDLSHGTYFAQWR